MSEESCSRHMGQRKKTFFHQMFLVFTTRGDKGFRCRMQIVIALFSVLTQGHLT